jgi:NADPH:quinone reductase-like Zn-dependent oxidoreductase
VHRYGEPSEALVLDDVELPTPGAGQLVVRTATTPLNYNEVDGCFGRYRTIDPPLPYTLGMEVVGEVIAAGEGGDAWVGRRVMATAVNAFGAHAAQVLVDADMTFDAPGSLDDIEAGAFFFPFHVAHLALFERGHIEAGQTVLVHAGAGGVGSAAVQLGATAGARVLATAGSDDKLARCRELGADVAINYRTDDVAATVLEATDGRELVVVMGRSGSGKTTLLNALGGLDRPTAGSVLVDGEDLYARGDRALSRYRNERVGFVFQSFHLSADETALENVLVPFLFARRPPGDARERARRALIGVDLAASSARVTDAIR